MTSRKFNPWCDSDKQTIPCATSLRAMYGELFSTILGDLFRNLMASVAQNVRENPQRAPWNNKNTEFEEGLQNMMGCSCTSLSVYMKAVYEYTPRVHSRKILSLYPTFRCITHNKASKPAKK